MSFKELLSKTTVANVVSGVVVIGGLVFGCWTRNTELVCLITGGALGYLYGKKAVA